MILIEIGLSFFVIVYFFLAELIFVHFNYYVVLGDKDFV